MITDQETNFVYFSKILKQEKYSAFLKNLTDILKINNIEYDFLSYTDDIWCRDYMPIQVDKKCFISFRYEPSYLEGKDEKRSIPKKVCRENRIKTQYSKRNLDGGNVVKWRNKVIVTNRIIDENPSFNQNPYKLVGILEELFQAKVILIPQVHKCHDPFGHADGYIRFVDSGHVIVNELNKEFKYFRDSLKKILKDNNLGYIEMPWFLDCDRKNPDSAVGNYINYLEIGNLILIPEYQGYSSYNRRAIIVLQAAFGREKIIEPIEATSVAKEGGVLNCVSWNIRKDV